MKRVELLRIIRICNKLVAGLTPILFLSGVIRKIFCMQFIRPPQAVCAAPAAHRQGAGLLFLGAMLAALFSLALSAEAQADTLTVYSARNEQLLKPLLDQFTKNSGTQVQLLTASEAALLARMSAEGASSPADVLITVDAGNLWQAVQKNLLQPLASGVLEKNIPTHLRDPANHWFGMSVRARTIVYSKARVPAGMLSTYEDLADPKWRGKLCLRTSKKVYNQSLVAMMMQDLGEAKTEAVVKGWVANLATDVFSDDTALLKAIAAGQCQVGIANTYYLARLLQADAAFPVGLFWANQATTGVHVNVSGAGVARHSKNPALARKFLEFLSSDEAQKIYSDKDLEFPANPAVAADSIIKSWGSFKPNVINVSKAGELQAAATRLMDRAGYR
jgi:iron(III) transport system substrate-binding protein